MYVNLRSNTSFIEKHLVLVLSNMMPQESHCLHALCSLESIYLSKI